jgi:hypothetical protein
VKVSNILKVSLTTHHLTSSPIHQLSLAKVGKNPGFTVNSHETATKDQIAIGIDYL